MKTAMPDISALIATLQARDDMSDMERAVLRSAPWRIRYFNQNESIVEQESEPEESCLLIEGFSGRVIDFADGRRQITALQFTGDFVDLHSKFLKVMDHNVTALSPVTAAFISHAFLDTLTATHPHLWRLLTTMIAIDAAIQRNWIAGFGRRSSEAQLAHFLCEIYVRMQIVGRTEGSSFLLPITQPVLGDLQGLSVVHVNRILQSLRSAGLIQWARKTVTITNWDGLRRLAEFNPVYLNLERRPR